MENVNVMNFDIDGNNANLNSIATQTSQSKERRDSKIKDRKSRSSDSKRVQFVRTR